MCDPPGVEPDDILEASYQNSFVTGVVEDKENIEIFPTTNSADESFEARSETAYGGLNNEFTISGSGLFCETTYLLVRNVYELHGSKSEKYFSSVYLIQPKSLHFHYFILKVPCLLQFFGRPRMKNILLLDQLHHFFCQDLVKKMVLMIFQLTFFQDS